MSTPPWDLYAEQLFPLGYGHPLWVPEREVHIGDVGWLKDGEFHTLFHSMPSGELQNAQRVPQSFRSFDEEVQVYTARLDKIMQPHICSRSFQSTSANADLTSGGSAVAPVSLGAGFQFKATSDTGAFVILEPPGKSENIESKRHIVDYMRKNFDSWYQFANSKDSWGLSLKEHDILFVYGTIKTTRWAVAAFQGDLKDKTGHVTGDFGPFASTGLSISVSNHSPHISHHRHGPRGYIAQNPPASDGLPTQCIFIHYYKMKRRLFWMKVRAAAGFDQLPPGAWDPGFAPPLVVEDNDRDCVLEPAEATTIESRYDPVDCVLDFIFMHSAAETAIASDEDVTAIFTNCHIPTDITAALQQVAPRVEIDEHGVGVIAVMKPTVDQTRSNHGSAQPSQNLSAAGPLNVHNVRVSPLPTTTGPFVPVGDNERLPAHLDLPALHLSPSSFLQTAHPKLENERLAVGGNRDLTLLNDVLFEILGPVQQAKASNVAEVTERVSRLREAIQEASELLQQPIAGEDRRAVGQASDDAATYLRTARSELDRAQTMAGTLGRKGFLGYFPPIRRRRVERTLDELRDILDSASHIFVYRYLAAVRATVARQRARFEANIPIKTQLPAAERASAGIPMELDAPLIKENASLTPTPAHEHNSRAGDIKHPLPPDPVVPDIKLPLPPDPVVCDAREPLLDAV